MSSFSRFYGSRRDLDTTRVPVVRLARAHRIRLVYSYAVGMAACPGTELQRQALAMRSLAIATRIGLHYSCHHSAAESGRFS
jgi:hypothetical protein